MENKSLQIITALALVVSLVLLTDPFMLWMTPMAGMAVLLITTVLLCVWGGLMMHERARDEREYAHRMNAGRVGYLSGVAVLTVALLVQGLAHTIDPWVALTLGIMVVAKLMVRFYDDRYR